MKWWFGLELVGAGPLIPGGQLRRSCGSEYTPRVSGLTLAEGKRTLSAVEYLLGSTVGRTARRCVGLSRQSGTQRRVAFGLVREFFIASRPGTHLVVQDASTKRDHQRATPTTPSRWKLASDASVRLPHTRNDKFRPDFGNRASWRSSPRSTIREIRRWGRRSDHKQIMQVGQRETVRIAADANSAASSCPPRQSHIGS